MGRPAATSSTNHRSVKTLAPEPASRQASAMRLPKRIFALLLGALLIVGLNLSAIRAADLQLQTMLAGCDMGDHHDCGDGGSSHKAMNCNSFCQAVCVAVLPGNEIMTYSSARTAELPVQVLPAGRLSAPDPLPPRSRILV